MNDKLAKNDPVFEVEWAEAVSLFNSGDRPGAHFRFRKLYESGYEEAAVEIANIYESDYGGGNTDYTKAIEWYKKAILVEENPHALLALGCIYLNGRGWQKMKKKLWNT